MAFFHDPLSSLPRHINSFIVYITQFLAVRHLFHIRYRLCLTGLCFYSWCNSSYPLSCKLSILFLLFIRLVFLHDLVSYPFIRIDFYIVCVINFIAFLPQTFVFEFLVVWHVVLFCALIPGVLHLSSNSTRKCLTFLLFSFSYLSFSLFCL